MIKFFVLDKRDAKEVAVSIKDKTSGGQSRVFLLLVSERITRSRSPPPSYEAEDFDQAVEEGCLSI